jgi:hypothetical protein
MQVKVIKDAMVLMPNKEHQNFTFTEKKFLRVTY